MFYAKNSRRNRDPHAPVIVRNGLGFVSGQLPIEARALKYVGRVEVELTLDDARTYARGGGDQHHTDRHQRVAGILMGQSANTLRPAS